MPAWSEAIAPTSERSACVLTLTSIGLGTRSVLRLGRQRRWMAMTTRSSRSGRSQHAETDPVWVVWLGKIGAAWHERALADPDQEHLVTERAGDLCGFAVLAGLGHPDQVIELAQDGPETVGARRRTWQGIDQSGPRPCV